MTGIPITRDSADIKVDADLDKVLQEATTVLSREGMSEVADRARNALATPPLTPTIVVIGEVKRGKSSLVNSLLGGRDVSPVDVDIATSAFLRFIPTGPDRLDGDTSLLFAGGRRRDIPIAELGGWVTESGRHVVDSAIDELPIGAEVAIDTAFLPDAIMVDTPGVGGLNPSHLRLATETAKTGSVLLMTCDASAPIASPELTFLEGVSGEIETVVIVLTKIDKYPRSWRSIVEENAKLLKQHTRFANAPIIGVSNLRARAALQLDPGDRRDKALASSGLPELAAVLRDCARSGERLAAVNCLRITRTGLENVTKQFDLRRLALARGEAAVADLTAEQERLKELYDKREGGWRDFLGRDLQRMRTEVLDTLEEELDSLKLKWRKRFETAPGKTVRRQAQLLVAEATADLAVLVGDISDKLAHAIEHLELEGGLQVTTDPLGDVRLAEERARDTKVWAPQMATMGFFGITATNIVGQGASALFFSGAGAGAGATVTAASITAITLPIGIVLGGTWIAVNYLHTAAKLGRQNLERWLNDAVVSVRKDVVGQVDKRIAEIRPIIAEGIRCYLKDSIAELEKQIRTAKEDAMKSQREKAKAIGDIDKKQNWIANTILPGIDQQLARFVAASPSANVGRCADN